MRSLPALGRAFDLSCGLSTFLGIICCVGVSAARADGGTSVSAQVAGSVRVTPVKSPTVHGLIAPLDNNVVGNARLLIPDGSSVNETFGADSVKWYTTQVEPGKSYVIEAFDPYGDSGSGSVSYVALFAEDGLSAVPEAFSTCGETNIAPAYGQAASGNGDRCIIRTFYPSIFNLIDQRPIFIQVNKYPFPSSTSFVIRVREATIYGRWTTNGYDFHVELQNTTSVDMCAFVELYPNSGTKWNGPSPLVNQLSIPAYGANKMIIPAGTLVGTDNRGTLRINDCEAAGQTITTGALHVSTYAFNPVTKQFLYFFPGTANNGNNGNSN